LKVKPVSLEGKYVLLRPPSISDLDGLSSAAQDGEIWDNPYALFPSKSEMSKYLQDLVKEQKTILPFIIIHKQSNKARRYFEKPQNNEKWENPGYCLL
jgi:hypothetical protein